MPGAVRRFGKKKVYIGGLLLAGWRARFAQLLLWRRLGRFVAFFPLGVPSVPPRQQPELGAGFRHGGVR